MMARWPEAARLGPEDSWFCIGSCFAQRSARALKQHLLNVHFAAGAPLYTPEAILRWLELCRLAEHGQKCFFDAVRPLFLEAPPSSNYPRRVLHPHTPGWLEAESAEELAQRLWRQCHLEGRLLKQSRAVVLTFGSSFSLYSTVQQCYWSNGHRLNAKNTDCGDTNILQKELFRPKQIERALEDSIQIIFELNPKAQIICSVSPLRHDPLPPEDNSLSKAQLLCAVHRLRRKAEPSGPLANWSYFPAYEIVMDELRDYRWYDGRQLRIEALALLLERLLAAVAGAELRQFLHQTTKLVRLLRHKPHNRDSAGLCAPQSEILAQNLLEQLQQQYPELPKDIQSCRKLLEACQLEPYTY